MFVLTKSCSSPNRLYGRRAGWSQHMDLEHWRLWKCLFGCNEAMDIPEKFKEHTSLLHRGEVSEQYINDLVRLGSFSDSAKARGDCPFCDQRLASDKLYISHVTLHLEHLALFALPSVEYDQDDEGDQGDHDNSEGYNQSGEEDPNSGVDEIEQDTHHSGDGFKHTNDEEHLHHEDPFTTSSHPRILCPISDCSHTSNTRRDMQRHIDDRHSEASDDLVNTGWSVSELILCPYDECYHKSVARTV